MINENLQKLYDMYIKIIADGLLVQRQYNWFICKHTENDFNFKEFIDSFPLEKETEMAKTTAILLFNKLKTLIEKVK